MKSSPFTGFLVKYIDFIWIKLLDLMTESIEDVIGSMTSARTLDTGAKVGLVSSSADGSSQKVNP